MGCQHLGNAIVCSRGRRRQLCSVGLCGKDSVALCDYPVERKGQPATCDSPMCAQHQHPVPGAVDQDWCEGHYNFETRQQHQRGGLGQADVSASAGRAGEKDGAQPA